MKVIVAVIVDNPLLNLITTYTFSQATARKIIGLHLYKLIEYAYFSMVRLQAYNSIIFLVRTCWWYVCMYAHMSVQLAC